MFNRSLPKLCSKILMLAILAGCLGFLYSDQIPVALASTCDSNFAYNVLACMEGSPPQQGAAPYNCNTYPGQYECCFNTYTDSYDLCVLQNGPIGATMLQPVQQPQPDPNAEQPSLIELKVRSCRMFGTGHNIRYTSCMSNGGTDDFCCMYAWTF